MTARILRSPFFWLTFILGVVASLFLYGLKLNHDETVIEQLQGQVRSLRGSLDGCETQRKTLQSKLGDCETRVVSLESERDGLRRRADELSTSMARVRQELSNCVSRSAELEAELDELLSAVSHQIDHGNEAVRIRLSWTSSDDLDLRATVEGRSISYANREVQFDGSSGTLLMDANASSTSRFPHEDIVWNGLPASKQVISVGFHRKNELDRVPFALSILSKNGSAKFITGLSGTIGQTVEVATAIRVEDDLVLNIAADR